LRVKYRSLKDKIYGMTRNYDLVVILDPEIKAEEQEKLLSKIKKFITDAEGKVSEVKEWGKKQLTYLISKKETGLFVELNLSLPSESAPFLRQKLQTEEKILRYLLVVEEKGPPSLKLRRPKEA